VAPSLSRPELIVAADPVAAAIERFLELKPRRLALAGGSTPRPLYEALATVDHDWAATDIFFTDERCVPPDHSGSNYRMAYEALLSKVPARIHRMPGETCDTDAYERELRAFFGDAPVAFDLVILGLGEDGHTASLFPGDAALDLTDRLVARVHRPDPIG
jgi:6-phosphogluconolactonase